jgi:hypothetical protein
LFWTKNSFIHAKDEIMFSTTKRGKVKHPMYN